MSLENLNNIEIDIYKPLAWQSEVLKNAGKISVICAGRRSGKTVMAVNKLLYEALVNPGTYWYVASTYSSAKEIAWRMLLEQFYNLPKELQINKNEQELSIELPNRSVIKLKGASKPDTLRGIGLKGLIVDECAFIDDFSYLWKNVLKPMLVDNEGWCWFMSSPLGFNHFYELYNSHQHFQYTSFDNPYLNQKELEEDRKIMSDEEYRQEYLAEFIANDSFSYFQGVDSIVRDIGMGPRQGHDYIIGCDIGRFRDSTVMIAIDRNTNEIHGFDSITNTEWIVQKARIRDFVTSFNNGKLFLDATNESGIAEDLQSTDPSGKPGLNVEAVRFTSPLKVEMYEKLRLYIAQRFITVPKIDKLINELKKFEFRKSNVLKLGVQSEHDDCVAALALAVKDLDQTPVVSNSYGWNRQII